MTRGERPQWNERITQSMIPSPPNERAYVVDMFQVPFDNPYKAMMFFTGIDFISNGDAILSTLMGDLWKVSGLEGDAGEVVWKRFAVGLNLPIGVKVIEDRIYAIGREQLSRITDVDGDGEADYYENGANDFFGFKTAAPHTYGLDVGGVSFALINDRKFKSTPGDVIDAMEPLFEKRGERRLEKLDTINERDFDTSALDREDLTLWGERQLDFLKEWGRSPTKLRAVLSQSVYCQPHHLMVADFDSNGWPQSGRKRALEVIRETGAVMIHGDLHFATLVQQGIDEWEDAGWSFTLPAVSTATHRAWRPVVEPENQRPGMPD